MISDDIRRQIEGYEAQATPGPWTAVGKWLWLGGPDPATTHGVEFPTAEDARLVAVLRSWAKDLLLGKG